MPNNKTPDDLLLEFEREVKFVLRMGFWANRFDLTLIIVSVLASLVATILAGQDQKEIPRWTLAAVAAIPAAATSLQRIIGIRERANWYFLYAARVSLLAKELKYAETPNVEEYVTRYTDMAAKMEEQWTLIGHSGAAVTLGPPH
jgi:hypothetical protein